METTKQLNYLEGQSIWVVDDEVSLVQLLTIHLKNIGLVVTTLESVSQVKEHLQQHAAPNILLSDVHMQDGTGYDVIELVQSSSITTDMLLMSGNINLNNKVPYERMCEIHYLDKPFSLQSLTLKLQSVVQSRLGADADEKNVTNSPLSS